MAPRVKILLGSHHFFPSTGGIETVSELLAREFVAAGHEVRVITGTPGDPHLLYPVIRDPAFELLHHVRWCDVFLQNNISLRTLWPLLFVRRPLFIIHQTWISGPNDALAWQHRLKRWALRLATSFSISRAVADRLPVGSQVVGNPYDDRIFKLLPAAPRTRELIFLGRLVSDKGVSLLLDALKLVATKPRLTIVGDGPERGSLERRVANLQLEAQVTFAGSQHGESLAALLRQHQLLVVPSLWQEPFGIVALEGVACGCVVVGSAGGGLAEAIGPCGITFPNGDTAALARAISSLLSDPAECERLRQNAAAHLARFTPRGIAAVYLNAMQKALR